MNNYRQKVEKKLGRKLTSEEVVHHIDGNNENNTLKNLQVLKDRISHNKFPKKIRKITKKDISQLSYEIKLKETNSFYEALHQLFTPYQIELIIKKSKNKLNSKTDREHFSRTVRKKLRAIANEQLYQISKDILYE